MVLVVGGASAAVAGTGALLRARRWRRALRTRGWVRGVLRIAGPAVISFEPEGYDELDPDDEPVRLRLMSTAVWRTRAVQQFDGGEIRAALVGEREWVLTAEGSRRCTAPVRCGAERERHPPGESACVRGARPRR